jgi:hypothetical protein
MSFISRATIGGGQSLVAVYSSEDQKRLTFACCRFQDEADLFGEPVSISKVAEPALVEG